MFTRLRPRLTFANVVSVMALFIALGGLSYAAAQIGSKQIVNNSIRSKDIRNGGVASRDIRTNTVGSFDIADNGVGTVDIADGAVGTGKLADGAVDTGKLADNAVGSGKIANGSVNNDDTNAELALAKGFATVDSTNVNGPTDVLNFGGQQTSTASDGVTAVRVAQGVYDVTFTGDFTGVNNVNDLTYQVTGRNGFSDGSIFDAASTADDDTIKLRVFMRRPDDGNTIDAAFSVQFYTRT